VGYKEHKLTGKCSLTDFDSWKKHAGDPLYNVLNPCCLLINAPGGWGANTIPTDFCQASATHLVTTEAGRKAYSEYVALLTQAVAGYPAAIGIELMNEPPMLDIESRWLYELYQEAYTASREISPDIAIGLADTGSRSMYPDDSRL